MTEKIRSSVNLIYCLKIAETNKKKDNGCFYLDLVTTVLEFASQGLYKIRRGSW